MSPSGASGASATMNTWSRDSFLALLGHNGKPLKMLPQHDGYPPALKESWHKVDTPAAAYQTQPQPTSTGVESKRPGRESSIDPTKLFFISPGCRSSMGTQSDYKRAINPLANAQTPG